MDHSATEENYALWTELLRQGKRVWATAGGDKHSCARDTALTSIYAEEKTSANMIEHLRKGDFVCGAVAIQMCIGHTQMGGNCDFQNQRLVIGIEKFHRSVRNPEHTYRLDVLDDQRVVLSEKLSCMTPTYLAMDVEERKFYRVEIWDETRKLRIAIGNPIWNKNM